MKTEEIKKQEELNDEQLDNVAGGGLSPGEIQKLLNKGLQDKGNKHYC